VYVKLLHISYRVSLFKYFQVWSVRIRRKRYIIWCCKKIFICASNRSRNLFCCSVI